MTGLTFIFMFAIIEFVFATIAWKGFGEKLWHTLYDLFQVNQNENQDVTSLIDETEKTSDLGSEPLPSSSVSGSETTSAE